MGTDPVLTVGNDFQWPVICLVVPGNVTDYGYWRSLSGNGTGIFLYTYKSYPKNDFGNEIA